MVQALNLERTCQIIVIFIKYLPWVIPPDIRLVL